MYNKYWRGTNKDVREYAKWLLEGECELSSVPGLIECPLDKPCVGCIIAELLELIPEELHPKIDDKS